MTFKKMFLIDAIGALISSVLLGFVLPYLNSYIGMPLNILYILAGLALIFFIYSLSCFFLAKENQAYLLKIIAIANILYCLLTISLVGNYISQLLTIGIIYFIIESLIIISLGIFELKFARN